MNELKELPIFKIGDTSFLVDIDVQVLRQTDDLSNEISFITGMVDKGDHYRLFYDPARKNLPLHTYDPATLLEVKVPPLIQLDPEGMSAKYNIPVDQMAGKTDFEVMVDHRLLAMRHNGILPKISIAGEEFIIDLRLSELRHARDFSPSIDLRQVYHSPDGQNYVAFYHPLIRQVVEIDPKLTEFPDGVVKIEFPTKAGLDPVGFARIYGSEEKDILRLYPIQKDLKAAVIPLSDTEIPAMIKRNRQALQEEHQALNKQHKIKHRPRF